MTPYEKRLEWQSQRIAELEAQIATAKKLGAVGELERMAHESLLVDLPLDSSERAVTLGKINERAAELRKELECPTEKK